MIPPVPSPAVQPTSIQSAGNAAPAAAAGSVALSRPPIQPSSTLTGAAIEANMAPVPPSPGPLPSPPPQAVAKAAVLFTEKWAGEFTRVGDLSGVNLRGAMRFVQPDVNRVMGDLSRGAPDSKLTADTKHLLSDWVTRGGQALQTLRRGLFQNTERTITQANASLSKSGVTSPEVHSAIREVNAALRTFVAQSKAASGGIPAGRPDLERLQRTLDYSMAKVTYAALQDIKTHPEHAQALQGAVTDMGKATRQLMQGMTVSEAMAKASMQELAELGLYPPPAQQPLAKAA